MPLSWFALTVGPKAEFPAMASLNQRGYFAFVPVAINSIRIGARRRPATARSKLIPGYVFAKMQHGFAARDVPNVRGVVSVAGEPAALCEQDVLELMAPRVGTAQPALSRKARRMARHLRRLEAQAA
jgi:transcription antitermination factor NusG